MKARGAVANVAAVRLKRLQHKQRRKVDFLARGAVCAVVLRKTLFSTRERERSENPVFLRCSALFGAVRKCSSHHAASMLKWSKAKVKHDLGG